MIAKIIPFRPVDGPLVEVNRNELVAQMAKALIEAGSYFCEREAIMSLMWQRKFRMVDIAMLLHDARQVAVQSAVEREMSAP